MKLGRLLATAVAAATFATACAGPTVMVAGESIRVPEPAAPKLHIEVIAADDLAPLDAELTVGTEQVEADENGRAVVEWQEDQPTELTATAPGFRTASELIDTLPEDGRVEIRLAPVILEGTVLTPDGRPLAGTDVSLGGQNTTTGLDGTFALARAVAGDLTLRRPAWSDTVYAWDGADDQIEVEMEPLDIKALRVGGDKAGNPTQWQALLDLADATEINAFVVDTKNEDGTVFHDTEVSTAHEIGAVQAFYDLDRVIADMEAHDLYKITRIVMFQDNPLARAFPEIAARDKTTGEPWKNRKGLRWLDPTDRESWTYSLELAEEACRRGFDEIQFDYVRFPSDGDISVLDFDGLTTDDYYSAEKQQLRVDTISAFLQEAYSMLNPMGCAVAADIFAITLESSTDEGIGQNPRVLSNYIDVLSPMIYTYTYGSGWKGFDNPNEHPVPIVSAALDSGLPRLEGFSIYRPWLQTWQLDADEIRAVQEVAEERGLGWMIWSANTLYNQDMFVVEGR